MSAAVPTGEDTRRSILPQSSWEERGVSPASQRREESSRCIHLPCFNSKRCGTLKSRGTFLRKVW